MINFDAEKMRSVYVYILKITTGYVYVTSHRNGEVFAPKGSKPTVFNGFDVQRVPIDQTVYQLYRRYSLNTEFHSPRLASLNMYADTIVSIEAQQYSRRLGGFQKADSWKSFFAKAIADIRVSTEGRNAFIDGVDIFWPVEADGATNLDDAGAFALVSCQAIRLGNLGRPLAAKATERAENSMDEAKEAGEYTQLQNMLDNHYHLSQRKGVVLRYRPEMGIEGYEGDYTTVYSSVLAEMPRLGQKPDKETKEQKEGKKMIRALFEMCHDTAPSQANLSFLISSAETIGKLYGMKEARFLNVPRVMKGTKQMCLVQIPESQRGMTPIGISAQSGLAWLFKFIYMEDGLKNLRALSKCMKKCLRYGLMPQSEDSLVRPEAKGKELPLVRWEEFKNKPQVHLQESHADFLERVAAETVGDQLAG